MPPHKPDQTTERLDKALEGQPAETRARVLEIITKYCIDPDDEFFIIFVALGQLQALIEDSPNDWQQLFINFSENLDAWSDTNLETLETIALEAKAAEKLSETCNVLSKSLQTFVAALPKLLTTSTNVNNNLNERLINLESRLVQLSEQLERQTTTLNSTFTAIKERPQPENIFSRLTSLISPLLLVVLLGLGGYVLYQQQQDNAKVLGWLLEKTTRLECMTGVKPLASDECRRVGL